ncbi:LacI family DNA-binding transcriptional regulator [Amycolatopsis jiangsuensis]|uniref:LacI family transcriptional regulator n=1 Tax=Amycolatopsis jiangsuensis TaxID=1181879 RepID=A0A840IM32_9PSEU|nr:LacI family DNA-binding transcriptional regulator [Amycolatopsis jiangsuensis]MBB4683431.1 LacI family transcriptional regulator [Amycolatopsis jiangsuensis]
MSITSHDVARLAGVSQPTVSRALRGDHRVSETTRARVREAAEALGYVPSEAGRSLSTRSTRRIGVVVTDLTNPFYPYLIEPLHDRLEQHGYRMMLFTERSETALETERLLDRSIDGVVLTTAVLGSALPAELTRRGLPFVFLNRETGTGLGDAAVVDNEAGGRLAAEELVRLGHHEVGLLGGPADTTTGRDRELGFRVGLSEAGVGLPRERVRRGPFDYGTGYEGLLELAGQRPRPTAVFCGNDVIAIGAMNAARRLGLAVPGDLTVIGFDDLPMASWETFGLTTVRHDLDGMAQAAAELLVERLAGTASVAPRRVSFAPVLVPRGTHAAR